MPVEPRQLVPPNGVTLLKLGSSQTDGESEGSSITATTESKSLARLDPSNEARELAELEDRLAADAELVTRLMFAGYSGHEWEVVAGRLAAYGVRVMTAWILDGTIVRRCKAKGWHVGWDDRCTHPEVAQDLARMVVAVALRRFRDDVLIPHLWDPQRGASLSTFFVGQSLLRWQNEYKTWWREQRRYDLGSRILAESPSQPVPDVAGRVVDGAVVADALEHADDLTRRIVLLRAAEYTWDEIAELTGSSVSKLRGRFTRFQKTTADRLTYTRRVS